jgi:putative membrane protein
MAEEDKPGETGEQTRLRLAAETTLLVWVRTCLGLMGFGFVVARFGLFLRELAEMGHIHVGRPQAFSVLIGTVLILLGVVLLLLALVSHRRFLNRLRRGEPEPTAGWTLGMTLCVVLAGLGMVLAAYLALID